MEPGKWLAFLGPSAEAESGEKQEGLWRGCFSPRGQIHLAKMEGCGFFWGEGSHRVLRAQGRVGKVGDTLPLESPSQLLCKLGCSPSANHRPFCVCPQPLPILVHAPLSRMPNKLMTGVVPFLLSLPPGIGEDLPGASQSIQANLSLCR